MQITKFNLSLDDHASRRPAQCQFLLPQMHKPLCALAFSLASAMAIAAPLTAKMVDYGTYELQRGDINKSGGVAGDLVTTYGNQHLVTTNKIDAAIGTAFGFRYILAGPQSSAHVKIRVIHPTPLKDPASGKLFAVSEWSQRVPVSQVNWNTGWSFEHKWELVPGEWKIQLHGEDGLLLEKSFIVSTSQQK